jgi:hypothetical protein
LCVTPPLRLDCRRVNSAWAGAVRSPGPAARTATSGSSTRATLQYVGERDFDMSAGKPVVTGNAAVVQRAFVSKAGQLP